jgi:hypothetical protein
MLPAAGSALCRRARQRPSSALRISSATQTTQKRQVPPLLAVVCRPAADQLKGWLEVSLALMSHSNLPDAELEPRIAGGTGWPAVPAAARSWLPWRPAAHGLLRSASALHVTLRQPLSRLAFRVLNGEASFAPMSDTGPTLAGSAFEPLVHGGRLRGPASDPAETALRTRSVRL